MCEDVFEVQSCCFLSCDFLVARNKNGSFSTIMVDDCENRITPFGFRELCYEIESDGFEWKCLWFGVNGLQGCADGVCVDLILLAFHTAFNILHYILGHFWPPILPRH